MERLAARVRAQANQEAWRQTIIRVEIAGRTREGGLSIGWLPSIQPVKSPDMQSEGPGFKSDPATHSVTLGKFLQVSEPHIPSSVKWPQWSVSACSAHDACAMDACCYNYLPCPPALPSVPASQWVAIPFTCPVTQALKEPLLPHASQYCWFFLGSSSCICCLSFFPVRAKSLQSYPTLLWPYGLYPARLLCPRGFSRQEYWSGLPGDLPNPGNWTCIS